MTTPWVSVATSSGTGWAQGRVLTDGTPQIHLIDAYFGDYGWVSTTVKISGYNGAFLTTTGMSVMDNSGSAYVSVPYVWQ
jgi:hypothetical protein